MVGVEEVLKYILKAQDFVKALKIYAASAVAYNAGDLCGVALNLSSVS